MNNKIKALLPAPKQVQVGEGTFEIGTFAGRMPRIVSGLTEDWRKADLVAEAKAHICRALQELAAMSEAGEDSASGEVSAAGDGAETSARPEEGAEAVYQVELRVDPDFQPACGEQTLETCNKQVVEEAYRLETGRDRTVITGGSPVGVYYGAVTFSQLLSAEEGKVLVPEVQMEDWPDFSQRGIYMECRYGTEFMTRQHWFDMVDYFESMKLNELQVNVYNCWSRQYDGIKTQCLYLPIRKYPQLRTPKNIKYYSVAQQKWIHRENILPAMYAEDFFGELIQYAARRNVRISPLLNSLGHNTLIPEIFPEISAVGEDGKPTLQGFCTRTERTYQVLFDIYDEVIDRYLLPNGIDRISIGLDEVGKSYICHCDKCKDASHQELMLEYIIRLCKYLKSKGMRTVNIYHDMLFHGFDVVNEELKERFIQEDIYDVVQLDWWSYEDPVKLFYGRTEEVNNLFRSLIKPATGYYHWAIPTENNENIRACAKLGKKLNFQGIEAYSSWEHCFDKNYLTLADVAWNADNADEVEAFEERYACRCYPDQVPAAMAAFRAMSDIMKDETREVYLNRAVWRLESYFYCYRKWDEPEKLRNFPGESYQRIVDKEEEYLPYLHYLKEKSGLALHFFEHNKESSHINETWRLSARHYCTLADEYLSLYGLHKAYNRGLAEPEQVIRELERLLAQREALMLLAERTRLDVNQYTYLRGMSWFRQFMLDLLAYFRKEVSLGNRPKLDMTDLRDVTGKELEFLQ